ncbi:methyltransferase [Candidatus Kinetoplastibacterium desouzaii TCC079E]|uniref:Release factor glutamine methyltransferase n=1 Tax=Candidatus Kinetoplastidibacterium desouzai TCC079E TaxID=1208919 RepID=M1LLK2_9PROT|nr:peptide chain release factor N(5)-glutamine methyltransferase [Candidatus Kinetoplastibacterium desouzaii]AGF46632.1 methyltransferase [Candidatus Kinetoplastibacterium desouzaii TCC079E]
MVSIEELIESSAIPRMEVMILLEHLLKKSRTWMIAHDSYLISSSVLNHYMRLVKRRLDGEPIAYLTGQKEFMGYNFFVNKDVLVPRPETELLVEHSLNIIKKYKKIPRIIDLGVGCGAIAISIYLYRQDSYVVGCDISNNALLVAEKNMKALKASINLLQSNWFDSISKQEKFDVIVANPPYIAKYDDHLKKGGLIFEPEHALTDGSIDGLGSIRIIVRDSINHMREGSSLWIEHGWNQAQQVRYIMNNYGFRDIVSLCDLSSIERVTGGFI